MTIRGLKPVFDLIRGQTPTRRRLQAQRHQQRYQRKGGGKKKGSLVDRPAADMAEKASKRRARDETDADCSAEKSHVLGALLGRCPVGDHGLDDAGVAGSESGDDAGREH